MINGFEYRDHSPKCPERSDEWFNEPDDEAQDDDEQDEQKDERTSDEQE